MKSPARERVTSALADFWQRQRERAEHRRAVRKRYAGRWPAKHDPNGLPAARFERSVRSAGSARKGERGK